MIQRFFLWAGLAAALTGCTTGYHSANNLILGYTGGYWDRVGPGKLTMVGFSANSFSNHEKVAVNLMYRCAELAQARNKPYFSFYSSVPTAIYGLPTAFADVSVTYGKPEAFGYVLFHDEAQDGAQATKAVLEKYQSRIRRF